MAKYFGVVQDQYGNVQPTATIDVYLTETVTHATLFLDDETTGLANPFNVAADGTYYFNVQPGIYDVKATVGVITSTKAKVELTAPFSVSVVKTASFTISNTLSLCDSHTDTGFAATLPTAAGVKGKLYWVKKTDLYINKVRVVATGAETIDGSTYFDILNPYDCICFISDGTNWQIAP
jgi:hypothetical protein